MKRYLMDTNILADYIYKRHDVPLKVIAKRSLGSVVGTAVSVIGEIYYGAWASYNPVYQLKQIQHRLAGTICWPLTRESAEMYGEIAAHLKKTGQRVQQIDIQIAAIALTLPDCTVVTTDSDFARIPGLSIENWRQPSS